MSFSTNKLKSHMLLTCKNFVLRFYEEKKNLIQEMVGGRSAGAPLSPFLYGPDVT